METLVSEELMMMKYQWKNLLLVHHALLTAVRLSLDFWSLNCFFCISSSLQAYSGVWVLHLSVAIWQMMCVRGIGKWTTYEDWETGFLTHILGLNTWACSHTIFHVHVVAVFFRYCIWWHCFCHWHVQKGPSIQVRQGWNHWYWSRKGTFASLNLFCFFFNWQVQT